LFKKIKRDLLVAFIISIAGVTTVESI